MYVYESRGNYSAHSPCATFPKTCIDDHEDLYEYNFYFSGLFQLLDTEQVDPFLGCLPILKTEQYKLLSDIFASKKEQRKRMLVILKVGVFFRNLFNIPNKNAVHLCVTQ